jgi:CubicO group peptidase (beta-lactamase class C family)
MTHFAMNVSRVRAIPYICLAIFIVWRGEAQSLDDGSPEWPVKTRQDLAKGIRTVDKLFAAEYQKERSAGLTVGIVSGRELVWTNNYGFADVENGKPATKETVYRIGSITKQFTALMLLQLVQAGKVHFSDPVEKFFPEVNRIAGKYSGAPPITLIQLATHHSGLSEEPDDVDRFTTGPVSQWEQTLIAALPKLKYEKEPDTHFIYSNIGYAALGAALSRAAGESYTDYIGDHIFRPLGMQHTRFEPDKQMIPALARGYVLHDGVADPTQSAADVRTGRGYKVPNGAVFTTVGDMARFVAFEMGYGPEIVLTRKALRESQSQMFWADGDATNGYGLGLMLVRKGNIVGLGHGGLVAGFLSGEYFDPSSHLGIIFLRNAEGHGFEPQFVIGLLGELKANAQK